MEPVNLIVSCSNRKKLVIPDSLRLRSIPSDSPTQRLANWLERLSKSDAPTRRAADLYAGDHWQVARSIVAEATRAKREVRLWICSAGYGLVQLSDMLKPYSATFTPGTPDSVQSSDSRRVNSVATGFWWKGLTAQAKARASPRSVTELAGREPRVPMVLVASRHYLTAMEPDLAGAAKALKSDALFSILSVGSSVRQLGLLGGLLLPGDARFETMVGGTRTALNVRIARWLFRQTSNETTLSNDVLTSQLKQAEENLPALKYANRKKTSDSELRDFIIKQKANDPTAPKTRLLTKLRNSGLACEQRRFSAIFNKIENKSANGQ